MTTALVYLGGSTLALLLLGFFYSLEDKRGHRIFLRRFRAGIDLVVLNIQRTVRIYGRLLWALMVRWSLQYGVHKLLQLLLKMVRSVELRIERILRHGQSREPISRMTGVRSHLDEIAAHKEESTLSTRDRNRLLQQ